MLNTFTTKKEKVNARKSLVYGMGISILNKFQVFIYLLMSRDDKIKVEF